MEASFVVGLNLAVEHFVEATRIDCFRDLKQAIRAVFIAEFLPRCAFSFGRGRVPFTSSARVDIVATIVLTDANFADCLERAVAGAGWRAWGHVEAECDILAAGSVVGLLPVVDAALTCVIVPGVDQALLQRATAVVGRLLTTLGMGDVLIDLVIA